MMARIAVTALLGLAALIAPIATASAAQVQCYTSANYFVMAQERTDDTGTDFIIKTLKPGTAEPACKFKPSYADQVLDELNGALWYEGLAGKYLVLTRSTGPDANVVIYDLASAKPVIDAPADEDFGISADKIVYWERIAKASTANCPELAQYEADGLGGIIAAETVLDVSTGLTSKTGTERCSETQ